MNTKHKTWVAGAMLLGMAPFACAQWQTQSFVDLAPGWNAIYLHVDATHTDIPALTAGTPVEEVWMWKPSVATAQLITTPDLPSGTRSRWLSWKTGAGASSSEFSGMLGNNAYLVKLMEPAVSATAAQQMGTNVTVTVSALPGAYQSGEVLEFYSGTDWSSPPGALLTLTVDAAAGTSSLTGNLTAILTNTAAIAAGDTGQRVGVFTYNYASPSDPKYTWGIKGKPVPPEYDWTTSGLNFFGVPSVPGNPKDLSEYFQHAGYLLTSTDFFAYTGGELSSGTNPEQVYGIRNKSATRGEAYWMNAGAQFNRYFGPFSLTLQSPDGVHFGDTLSTYRVRLSNMTSVDLTVSVTNVVTESSPAGETANRAPVLVRGALNTATLEYGHTALAAGAQSWTLNPKGTSGSELEVVLGLNRSAMTGESGTLYASLLRFTDNLGHSQVDIPVSGKVGTTEGLWVGAVGVTDVRHSLSTGTNTFGKTASPYPLRLILHKERLSGVTVIDPGVTVTSNVSMSVSGAVVEVPVDETSRAFPRGTVIAFSGGGQLTLTSDAASGATTLSGVLTVQDLASGETAISGATRNTRNGAAQIGITVASGVTAGAGASKGDGVSVTVAATPRAYATGQVLTFFGGGVLTLTTNAVAGATNLTGNLTVADIGNGETVPENVSQGTGVGVNVGATTNDYSTGDRIEFSGGGVLKLTADAATEATTLTGNLTVAGLVEGDEAVSWTAESTPASLLVTSLPRPLYVGEAIRFSGGGVLTLTNNAPVNSTLLLGTLSGAGADIAAGDTGGANRLKMLQRVFVGKLATGTLGVATRESLLDSGSLAESQRISCIHLPVSDSNLPWVCGGTDLAAGEVVSASVDVDFEDQASNPFLHTYHPDHDNLVPDFTTPETRGRESYTIKREMKLAIEEPGSGFASLTGTGTQLTGTYEETMTLLGVGSANKKSYSMKGAFVLNRISEISTLTTE